MSRKYAWRREGSDRLVFDGPNSCHNHYRFVGLSSEQLDEIAALLDRAYWAGGEDTKANIRSALGVSL